MKFEDHFIGVNPACPAVPCLIHAVRSEADLTGVGIPYRTGVD